MNSLNDNWDSCKVFLISLEITKEKIEWITEERFFEDYHLIGFLPVCR